MENYEKGIYFVIFLFIRENGVKVYFIGGSLRNMELGRNEGNRLEILDFYELIECFRYFYNWR